MRSFIAQIFGDEEEEEAAINEDKHHNMFSFKIKGCTLKFYQTTKKIMIQGAGSPDLIQRLSDFIKAKENKAHVDEELTETSKEDDDEPTEPDQISNQKESTSVCEELPTNKATNDCECSFLKIQLWKIQMDVAQLKTEMLKRQETPFICSHANIDETTNQKLCEENEHLKEVIALLKKENCELANSVHNLKSEKESLITALKVCHFDQNSKPRNDERPLNTNQTNTTKPSTSILKDNVGGSNRSDKQQPNTRKSRKQQNSSNSNNSDKSTLKDRSVENSSNQRSTTVIIGDSIISRLQGWRMSDKKNKVIVRSFPGAKVDDLFHYVIPTLQTKPDRIIVHVGSNDLKTTEPRAVAEKVVELCEFIEAKSPSTKILVSELTPRNDFDHANDLRKQVNKIVRSFAKSRDWASAHYPEMNIGHLNSRGVHLNTQGTSKLARYLKQYISGSDN